MNMSWVFDIIILVVIAIPTFIGLKVGVVKALLIVVGGIVGIVLAGRYSDQLGAVFSDAAWAKVVAFAVILLATLIVASIIARLVKFALSAVLLGWVNRLGGAVLGFILGAFFCGAVLTMWVKYMEAGDIITGSALASFLVDGFPIALGLFPAQFDSVRDFFNN
jgi:membrane protein required for colicin V production